MNKEITVYDLLGLIKDCNAPKKIKCNDLVFMYSEPSKDYVYEKNNCKWLFKNYLDIGIDISKKVEILEENKDIEEVNFIDEFTDSYYDTCLIKLGDKMNEVIREVNKLRKENK